jgi:parallel beta-helix repeat protein
MNFEYGIKFTWLNFGADEPKKVNTVADNTIINNTCGILINEFSAANLFSGNRIEDNVYGVQLSGFAQPAGNVFKNNMFSNNRYSIADGSNRANDVDTSNTVNGKPVYYWVDKHDMAVPADAGCVVLKNCSGITVQNLQFINNGQGILLCYTTNSTITGNVLTGNAEGITLRDSSNNEISGNIISESGDYGIKLYYGSSDNTVSENNIEGTGKDGVHVEHGGSGNTIIKNQINNSQEYGIYLSSFQNSVIAENNITLSKVCGINLQYGANENTVRGNYLTKNGLGILVETAGITITENTMIENYGWAMRLNGSQKNNKIHHNNFINNNVTEGLQVSMPAVWLFDPPESSQKNGPTLAAGNPNSWDDGKEGNYWSDYLSRYPNASEAGNTGVGDTAYFINENNIDYYPLMKPYGTVNADLLSPSASPTQEHTATPSPNTQTEIEPPPTALVVAISVASVAIASIGLMVYLKKHNS